ncbi:MAG: PKD domain-containing protein, partial [Bacteroidales bacterium]
TSVATARVFVLGSMGGIYIPSAFVCNNGEPFEVSASNVAGETGTFKLLNVNEQEVAGLNDLGNNTAMIDPALLIEGSYTVEYNYFDGVVHHLRKTFDLESVTTPMVLNLTDESYCQNITPFQLEADDENARFSGPGVAVTDNGYMFDPSGVNPGNIKIFCENVSEHGCSEGMETTVEILAAPQTQFTLNTQCIPSTGGQVSFDNLTPEKLSVESWVWDFGDPSSGEQNQSSNINPVHTYTSSGARSISLTATNFNGCAETALKETTIGAIPSADFTWISDCYLPGRATGFLDRSVITDSPDSQTLRWTFMDKEGTILDAAHSGSSADTLWYEFTGAEGYMVQLIAESEIGCTDSILREIDMRPTVVLTDEGYLEEFNQGDGQWVVKSEEGPTSWVLSEPDFSGFDAIAGDHAWHTQFPAGTVGYLEHSWVQSPCFDFSDIEKGMIQMNVMKSFVPNLNGAVLQYRDIVEEGWKIIGESTPGVNWYNVVNLINKPGGSGTAWGLEVFHPDQEWVRTAHDLNGLNGKTNVSFRIAIASTGAQGIGNQGFAFDDVFIGERTKHSVLEHFTNASTRESRLADNLIDSLSQRHSEDIIDIQYHTDFPGEDPMNDNNPFPANSRTFYYGIEEIPYAVLDGGILDAYRYDFPDLKSTPLLDEIALASLEVPPFGIHLSVDWMDTGLESAVTVTCTHGSFPENIQLYTVVFEKEVTVYKGLNGDTLFRNVVLDMLPDPTGSLLGKDWNQGDSVSRTYSWTYQPYMEDISDLGVVAFIQERETGKILQAEVSYRKWDVGIDEGHVLTSLNVFPNPVKDMLYVNLGRTSEATGMLRLVDMNGREVIAEQVPSGYQIYQMELGSLNRGIYILYWFEGGQFRGLAKIVKTE